jgi:O-methyltransferase involved in polyketide biosynthesis
MAMLHNRHDTTSPRPQPADRVGKMSLAHLDTVSETLVIPLWARSVESRRGDGLLQDPQAERIVAELDYDFARFRDAAVSQLTVCLRARAIDRWVGNFLRRHPTGTVCELGVGLDTRFDRLENNLATYLEVDLPEVIALRRCFFSESRRRQFIADSVVDSGWIERTKQTGGAHFFVAEGLLMYLRETEVKALFSRLADQFPDSRIAFDTFSPLIADNLAWHDTMRFMRVGFNWSITQVRDIQGWDSRCRVIESVGLEELGEHLHRLTLNQCMMLWALQFTPTYGVHLLQFAGNK